MQLRAPPHSAAPKPTYPWSVITAGVVCSALLGVWVYVRTEPTSPAADVDNGEGPKRLRSVASKLKAAGALNEAALLYAQYLDRADLPADTRAKVAYSLGSLYLDAGQYDRALRWLYEAESTAPAAVGEGLGKKIVHVLERMGRTHAAKAALTAQTQLAPDEVAHADSDPVVARMGATVVRRSDITRAMDDLPAELAKRFGSPEGKQAFLRQYVADELLMRKAAKLEYDKRPEVQRRLEAVRKQLIVNAFVDNEIVGKVQVSDADLKTYFQANQSRYDQAEAAKVRMVKVADDKAASTVMAALKQGTAFADVAKKHSLDKATAREGGALGRWISKTEPLVPEGDAKAIAEAVFATPKGKFTQPIAAGNHVYVFEVEDLRAGKPAKFEDVRQRVERDYRMMKTQAAYTETVDKELSSEDVEWFFDKLTQGS